MGELQPTALIVWSSCEHSLHGAGHPHRSKGDSSDGERTECGESHRSGSATPFLQDYTDRHTHTHTQEKRLCVVEVPGVLE